MKLNIDKKISRFKERALQDFTNALFTLLHKQSFESITVNMLCDACNYPRSTFYNCFEDLYDLMDYAWSTVGNIVLDETYIHIGQEKHTEYLFQKFYVFLQNNRESITKITKYNSLDGQMIESLRRYMKRTIFELMNQCMTEKCIPLPKEMLVEHYSNTITLVLDWCFLRNENITAEQAYQYIRYLLVSLES